MADFDYSHPPHTPSPQILTPVSGSSTGFRDILIENQIKPAADKHPVSRDRVTAGSAAAKELGTLFRETQDKLMALNLRVQGSLSTTSKTQTPTEEAHGYHHQDRDFQSFPTASQIYFDSPEAAGADLANAEPIQSHEIAKKNDHGAKIDDSHSGFDVCGRLCEFPLQTLLRTSSSMRDTISSSPQSTPESSCTPNTNIECPGNETDSLYDEAQGFQATYVMARVFFSFELSVSSANRS